MTNAKHTCLTPIEAAYVAGTFTGKNIKAGCPVQLVGMKQHLVSLEWSLIQGGYDVVSAKSMVKASEAEGCRATWR